SLSAARSLDSWEAKFAWPARLARAAHSHCFCHKHTSRCARSVGRLLHLRAQLHSRLTLKRPKLPPRSPILLRSFLRTTAPPLHPGPSFCSTSKMTLITPGSCSNLRTRKV